MIISNDVIRITGKIKTSDNTIQPVVLTRNVLWQFVKIYFKSFFGKKFKIWAIEYTHGAYSIVVQKYN